jgi:hypothetical protein
MGSPYFINPSPASLARALDAWQWLALKGKQPLLVTAFADVFFTAPDGIWLLDTLEGDLKHLFGTQAELEQALKTEEMEDTYLMTPLIDHLLGMGMVASDTRCYDYKLHPRLGGQIHHDNIELRDFVVALHLRGQLHEQVRHLKPGTRITEVKLEGDAPKPQAAKPWWKRW